MPTVRYYGAEPGHAAAYLVRWDLDGPDASVSAVVARWDAGDQTAYWWCCRHKAAWSASGDVPPPCICLREVSEYRAAGHLD